MDFKTYLETRQPLVFRIFSNAVRNKKIAQTYLIKGNEGAPVLETARFLAKSLVCENASPLACSSCLNCLRFEEGNYSDFMLLDGEKRTLKVTDIEELQAFLSSSYMERSGKKIYVIHCLENSNKETLNALLKTLEEPYENVYAFITTRNDSRLLPTILSRCQILNLLPSGKEALREELAEKGVSIDDAEILSALYNHTETILATLEDEKYKTVKECLSDALDALDESLYKGLFYAQSELISRIKTKEQARLFIDLLSLVFKDILYIRNNQKATLGIYSPVLTRLAKKIANVDQIYSEIMLARGKIESNVSISLLLEHLFISMIKGGITDGK